MEKIRYKCLFVPTLSEFGFDTNTDCINAKSNAATWILGFFVMMAVGSDDMTQYVILLSVLVIS